MEDTIPDGSGDALVEHWKRMGETHRVNQNTAGSLRAACTKVLSAVSEDWKTVDVRTLDVDEALQRFENKYHREMTSQSLATYKSRFRNALTGYLEYLENPSGWKPKTGKPRGSSSGRSRGEASGDTGTPNGAGSEVEYEHLAEPDTLAHRFPLSDGSLATLVLPVQLRKADVKRLTAFLDALAFEDQPTLSAPRELNPGTSS